MNKLSDRTVDLLIRGMGLLFWVLWVALLYFSDRSSISWADLALMTVFMCFVGSALTIALFFIIKGTKAIVRKK